MKTVAIIATGILALVSAMPPPEYHAPIDDAPVPTSRYIDIAPGPNPTDVAPGPLEGVGPVIVSTPIPTIPEDRCICMPGEVGSPVSTAAAVVTVTEIVPVTETMPFTKIVPYTKIVTAVAPIAPAETSIDIEKIWSKVQSLLTKTAPAPSAPAATTPAPSKAAHTSRTPAEVSAMIASVISQVRSLMTITAPVSRAPAATASAKVEPVVVDVVTVTVPGVTEIWPGPTTVVTVTRVTGTTVVTKVVPASNAPAATPA